MEDPENLEKNVRVMFLFLGSCSPYFGDGEIEPALAVHEIEPTPCHYNGLYVKLLCSHLPLYSGYCEPSCRPFARKT